MNKKSSKNKEKFVCQSTIINDYGIPKSIIEKHLPVPRLVDNPHYKCASPMKLYALSAVTGLLSLKEVQDAIEKRKRRSLAAKKAVETKLNNINAKVEAATQNLIIGKESNVEDNAIAAYNEHESYKTSLYDDYAPRYITTQAPKEVLDRITVNYIRHQLTDYDDTLYLSQHMTGKHSFYRKYRNNVLDAIANAYPTYAAECENQKIA